MYLYSFLLDLEAVKMGNELLNRLGSCVFETSYGEIRSLQFIRFTALGPKQSCQASAYGDKDVVAHFRSIGVVDFNHVVHVDDSQRRYGFRLEVFYELIPIGKASLVVDKRMGPVGLGVPKPFEFGNVVTDDLKGNDLPVFDNRRHHGMKPKKIAVFRPFANVPFPNVPGGYGIPESFPKTGVMDSGSKDRHVPADEFGFRIT